MPQATTAPAISVLMLLPDAPGNALGSVQSVLAQGFADFELLVPTRDAILPAIDDPRLRVLAADAGWAGLLAAARAPLVAWIRAGDVSRPDRLAKQAAYLAAHPEVAVVGAGSSELGGGQRGEPGAAAAGVDWRLYLGQAPPVSTLMARSDLARQAGGADGLEFLHRMRPLGGFKVLPEGLGLHCAEPAMAAGAGARALSAAYAELLGPADGPAAAVLVARHLLAGERFGPGDARSLIAALDRLARAYAARHRLSGSQVPQLGGEIEAAWARMTAAMLRAGHLGVLRHVGRAGTGELLRALRRRARAPQPPRHDPVMINSLTYRPQPPAAYDPPVLHVVVDTEAEFDWNKGFDRTLTAVSGMRQQEEVQTLFESWGMRPIYVVDYAVASQPEGFGPLRGFLDRRGCVVGAHMHAWITPPFEETISEHNSFGGNLPRELEARKLRSLVETIRRNFDIDPLIFRAGRYGIGPNTIELLAELGFQLDLSLLPGADLRPRGGPDFRFTECVPYRAGAMGMLSIPMTRGQIGALAPLPPGVNSVLQSPLGRRMRLPGVMARLGLANTVTLTPEGVPTGEQLRLIDAMLARGCRSFMLHYHSPSLGKQTPYVRSDADLATFLNRIEAVCRHFFIRHGGLPGHPADLLPQDMRGKLWPGSRRPDPAG